jgi:formylglycine-generating enzyme required for sulfatase activity
MRTGVAVAAFSLVLLMLASRLRAPDNRPQSTWQDRTTGMQFVLINPGTFVMGSPPGEAGREAQETQHTVTLTRPFYMGRFEVTQAEWMRVMGRNPSHFQDCGSRCPVERVSFDDIVHFLERLNDLSEPGFRLPTEAEWEYAAHGTDWRCWPWGDDWDPDVVNCAEHWYGLPISNFGAWHDWWAQHRRSHGIRLGTTAVGQFSPAGDSPFGVADLAGNVSEWTGSSYRLYDTSRRYHETYERAAGRYKVLRGGSWMNFRYQVRTSERFASDPAYSSVSIGFRCASSTEPPG